MSAQSLCESLSSAALQVVPILLDTAVKGAAILLLATVATLAMRRASAAARHWVWFLAAFGGWSGDHRGSPEVPYRGS